MLSQPMLHCACHVAVHAGDDATSRRPASAKALQGKEARRVRRSDARTINVGENGAAAAGGSSSQQVPPRTEPPVTRSMSRLGMGLFSPVPEHKAKCGRCAPHMQQVAAEMPVLTMQVVPLRKYMC